MDTDQLRVIVNAEYAKYLLDATRGTLDRFMINITYKMQMFHIKYVSKYVESGRVNIGHVFIYLLISVVPFFAAGFSILFFNGKVDSLSKEYEKWIMEDRIGEYEGGGYLLAIAFILFVLLLNIVMLTPIILKKTYNSLKNQKINGILNNDITLRYIGECERAFASIANGLRESIDERYNDISGIIGKLYDKYKVPEEFRGFECSAQLLNYIESDACDTLEGEFGAYEKLRAALSSGDVTDSVIDVEKALSSHKKRTQNKYNHQKNLVMMIKNKNDLTDRVFQELWELLKTVCGEYFNAYIKFEKKSRRSGKNSGSETAEAYTGVINAGKVIEEFSGSSVLAEVRKNYEDAKSGALRLLEE